jgi:hypothetical protein
MTVYSDFKLFLTNIQIKNAGQISGRYGSITRRLNLHFRGTDNKKSNCLQVGSYGRYTGIDGISDLDMLYIMPPEQWSIYKNDQSGLLDKVREQITKVYPQTETKKDRNVVVVTFSNYVIEIVPVFELKSGEFYYPDTYNGGSWPKCNPRAELSSFKAKNDERNGNLRYLAKMVRAWRKRNNIVMSGFLIDTLCYKFLDKNTAFDQCGYGSYDVLARDFFYFLENQPDRAYYLAPGSNSQVTVYKKFQRDAKSTREICDEAISARMVNQNSKVNQLLKQIFGRNFPNYTAPVKATTEEFIEERYDQNLQFKIQLECEFEVDLMTKLLSRMLASRERIKPQKTLKFTATNINIEGNFDLKWKVLNKGELAEKQSEVRGQILDDDGSRSRTETSKFFGDHIVECYAIQNEIVIARDRIEVPIE